MELIHAIILGAIEGFTEFLPVSSTAHLLLTEKLLGLENSEFIKSFSVAIQLGAILSVAFIYIKPITDTEVIKRMMAAFLPTAAIGYFLYTVIKGVFFESIPLILGSLFLFGIVLVVFEKKRADSGAIFEEMRFMPLKTAFFIGCFQALAVIPGVSRSGATIIGGLLLGVSRKTIVEFSFLLAVPTMAAAVGYDLIKSVVYFSGGEFGILVVGFVISFIFAMAAIKFFLGYVSRNSFEAFGWYRIVLAAILAAVFYV